MAHVRCDTDGTPFMIPASVTRDELNEALEPFYALLNITKNHVFEIPGITIGIGDGCLTFLAPSPATAEDWAKDRPPANVTRLALQGVDEGAHGEMMQLVKVRVVDSVSNGESA